MDKNIHLLPAVAAVWLLAVVGTAPLTVHGGTAGEGARVERDAASVIELFPRLPDLCMEPLLGWMRDWTSSYVAHGLPGAAARRADAAAAMRLYFGLGCPAGPALVAGVMARETARGIRSDSGLSNANLPIGR